MSFLATLRKDPNFWGTCSHCGSDFPLKDAQLFALSGTLPETALARIAELRADLKDQRRRLAQAKELMTERAAATSEAVNLGKICEKIVPSFAQFPFAPRDCRSLLEPIDFVAFPGLTASGTVEAIAFIEVKTGKAALSNMQKLIAETVTAGRVEFDVLRTRER